MPSYSSDLGIFLPTTVVVNTIAQVSTQLNNISLAVNAKETGIYPLVEIATSQSWFPDPTLSSATAKPPVPRPGIRKVFNLGALANAAGTSTIAHGITTTASFFTTHIVGSATHPSNKSIPLPYPSAVAADVVEVWLDAVNINIKVGKDMSMFTQNVLVVEFLQY